MTRNDRMKTSKICTFNQLRRCCRHDLSQKVLLHKWLTLLIFFAIIGVSCLHVSFVKVVGTFVNRCALSLDNMLLV